MSQDQPDYTIPSLGPISKDSRLEWQSTLWNDNNIQDGQIPPAYLIGVTYKGKFFPRGCRGKIEELRIYCRRTDAGTLTLAISPHPCMGETYTVIVTPGANWAWVGTVLRVMWNYDSMFIWVKACSANVRYAYDTLVPRDGHTSGDVGATWQREDRRYYIRAIFDAESAGDVPVSGTINTVEIPSVASEVASGVVAVPHNVETVLATVDGAGTLLALFVRCWHENCEIRIYVDGTLVANYSPSTMNTWGFRTDTPFRSLTRYQALANENDVWVTLPFKFRRQFQVRGFQQTGGPINYVASINSNLIQ